MLFRSTDCSSSIRCFAAAAAVSLLLLGSITDASADAVAADQSPTAPQSIIRSALIDLRHCLTVVFAVSLPLLLCRRFAAAVGFVGRKIVSKICCGIRTILKFRFVVLLQ